MESANRQAATLTAGASPGSIVPYLPLLLALFLAPLIAGSQDLLPALVQGGLIWLSLLLRSGWPGLEPLHWRAALWSAALFPLVAVLSLLGTANPGATVIQIVLYAGYAAALWLAADCTRRNGPWWLLGAIAAGALVAGGMGLREWGMEVRRGNPGWRAFGQFTNPNFFAGFLAPALLACTGLALHRPRDFRPSTWTLALALLCGTLWSALLVTASRGGLLAAGTGGVVLCAVALARRDLGPKEVWLRTGVLLAVFALGFLAFSGELRERQQQTNGPAPVSEELCPREMTSRAADSNRFRRFTWESSWRMGRKRPVYGWGAGAFEAAYAPFEIAGYTRQAHNGYLQIFAEEGWTGLAAFTVLVLTAVVSLLRAPRTSDRAWVAGTAGALTAVFVHNLFDSTLFVPAVALVTWVLLGTCFGAPEAVPVPADAGASRRRGAGEGARKQKGMRVAGAVAGLVATGWLICGRMILSSARSNVTVTNAGETVEALKTAQLFLPWDPEVYLALSHAESYQGLGKLDDAISAANRALQLQPYRMPTYFWIGQLRKAQGRPDIAFQQYQLGLSHQPHEVQLLYGAAQLAEDLRINPLPFYQNIARVEDSPVGQVNALGEVRDYRYARARMVIARNDLAKGDRAAAQQEQLRAACLLTERRALFEGNPDTYLAVGGWDRDTERQLRTDEQNLWRQLSREYAQEGDPHRAELAEHQAAQVDASRDRLEQFIKELPARAGE